MDRQGETAGERRTEDEWWHDLYEEGVPDTGPQRAGDTLDDRFASVTRAVDEEEDPAATGPSRPPRPSAAEPYDQMRDPDYPPPPAPSTPAPSVAGVPGFTERAEPAAARGWTDDVFAGLREDDGPPPRTSERAPERKPEPEPEPVEPPEPAAGEAAPWWDSADRDPAASAPSPPAPRETAERAPADEALPDQEEPAAPLRATPTGTEEAAEPAPPDAVSPDAADAGEPDSAEAAPTGPRESAEPDSAATVPPAVDAQPAPSDPVHTAPPAAGPPAPEPLPSVSVPAAVAAASEAEDAPTSTMRLRQVSVTDTLTDVEWARRGGEFVGGGPPTYEAEPTALPEVAPGALVDLVPDTVLDGARYGSFTLRAVSTRGDSPRYRGEQRRDALLTARFGGGDDALVFVAVATGARGVPRTDRAADSLVRWMGEAVGRSRARLSEDIRTGRRAALKGGLHRLTGRTYGLMRAQAEEFGVDPAGYTAGLRCLLLSADPACRTRVFFGTGPGGLFRLRGDEWQDLEPAPPTQETPKSPPPAQQPPADPRLTVDLGVQPQRTAPAGPPPPGFGALVDTPDPGEPAPFAFRASEGRPGDVLLLCSPGFAEPLRGAPGLVAELAERWRGREAPPGLAAFLGDVQLRAKGFADDRTAAALWES